MKFDKYAKGYDAGWRGTKSARFYDDLINELDIQPNDAVLDVGCGTETVPSLYCFQYPHPWFRFGCKRRNAGGGAEKESRL